jgi:hypothetical protein
MHIHIHVHPYQDPLISISWSIFYFVTFNVYIVLRHLKFINDITTYSLYCNIYTIKSIKFNIDHKMNAFYFT